MVKGQIEKFGLKVIADAVRGSDVLSARDALSFALGAAVDVSGTVRKVVKRNDQFKLVIESGDVPGFVIFADCLGELENLTKPNIRKGSAVWVKGKLQSFGALAACLSDCRLIEKFAEVRAKKRKKTQRKRRENILQSITKTQDFCGVFSTKKSTNSTPKKGDVSA